MSPVEENNMQQLPIFDHAVINVDDQLDEAFDLFTRMGFQLSKRGHHTMGSSNHLAIFGENYLELLGYETNQSSDKRGLWHAPLGLTGLVWKTADASQTYDMLTAVNLAGEPPTAFSREVVLPNGDTTTAKFCITRIASNVIPNGFSFFCQHETPEAVRQPEWQQHPNGVLDITAFVIVADQPHQAMLTYQHLFSSAEIIYEPLSCIMRAGTAEIRILTPTQATEAFGPLTFSENQQPKMAALCLKVDRLARLEDCLLTGGIQFEKREHSIMIPESSSFHIALSFHE